MNKTNSFIFVLLLLAGFGGCRKEDTFTQSSSAKLTLSDDTLFFDTVFSTFGPNTPMSVTKQLWVINHNSQGVRTNIRIKGTANGSVKMNVDGKATDNVTAKEIRGNDSIVIFVQIYSNPGNNFIVTDQILFETNGNAQDVDIVAYGRDAHYHDEESLDSTQTNIVWANDKPHVIYNSVLVNKGQTLTINPDVKIYSHINSTIYVQGTLIVNGSVDKPVIFSGDRLDADYADITGQWIGIRILPGSINNTITWGIIRNGFLGIEVDSASANGNPNLIIKQSIINNMKAAGIVGYSAKITAINNLISNCGEFSFYGALGGDYNLFYNTLACYNLSSSRQNAQLFLDNTPYDDGKGTILKFPLNFQLVNNIVYGSLEDELTIQNNPDGDQTTANRSVLNNLIRTKITGLGAGNNITNQDPLFKEYADRDITKHDYTLKDNSPAKLKAQAIPTVTTIDLKNISRNGTTPTMGAYE